MSESVNISFVGDIYLGEQPYLSLTPEIGQILRSADLAIANQEGPITDYGKATGGKCCLKSDVKSTEILKDWGIDVVSIANNHMFDYGWKGFKQTRQQLDRAGIRYFGAGENLEQAGRPLIVEVKGTRIGLLAYSWEFVQTTCASEDSYGCAPLDKELMVKQIHEIKNQVDTVIVLPHWGYCEYYLPTAEQVELGKRLIEAGATAVIGHHSHIVQGIVRQSESLVAFSLGNFAFAEFSDRGRAACMTKDNMEGVILEMELKAGKIVSYNVVFTILKDGLIQVDNSSRRSKGFTRRSEILTLPDYGRYWRRFVRRRMLKRVFYWANVFNWRYIHKETLIGGWLMLKDMFQTGKR